VIARILAAGLALTLVAGGEALACQSRTGATFDDTFQTPDPGWGPPDQAASFGPDGLVLKPPVNGSAWRWDQNYTIDGKDLCITVVNPTGPTGNADVGVWFWGRNGLNFYTATISLGGSVAIDRLANGVWHEVLPPRPSDAVRTQPGQVNEIEVTVHGDAATFYVNDTKIADFHGIAPPQGGPPGVYAESGDKTLDWVFQRVRLF
jgi:hypothetical protein